jgi:hypothetical protein
MTRKRKRAPITQDRPYSTIEAYWKNSTPFNTERDANRAKAHDHFDAHRDAALFKLGYI